MSDVNPDSPKSAELEEILVDFFLNEGFDDENDDVPSGPFPADYELELHCHGCRTDVTALAIQNDQNNPWNTPDDYTWTCPRCSHAERVTGP